MHLAVGVVGIEEALLRSSRLGYEMRFVSTVDAPRLDQCSNYTDPDVGAIEGEGLVVDIVISGKVAGRRFEPAQASGLRCIHHIFAAHMYVV
jgi:hypothetical protein